MKYLYILLFAGILSAQQPCDGEITISSSRFVSWESPNADIRHVWLCDGTYHGIDTLSYRVFEPSEVNRLEALLNPNRNITINVNLPEFTPWIDRPNLPQYRINGGWTHILNSAIVSSPKRTVRLSGYTITPRAHAACPSSPGHHIDVHGNWELDEDVDPELFRSGLEIHAPAGDWIFWSFRDFASTNDIGYSVLSYFDWNNQVCGNPLLFNVERDDQILSVNYTPDHNQGLFLVPKTRGNGMVINELKITPSREPFGGPEAYEPLPEITINGTVYYYAYVDAFDDTGWNYRFYIDGSFYRVLQVSKGKYHIVQL